MSRLTGQERTSVRWRRMTAIEAWAFRGQRFLPLGRPFEEFAAQNLNFRRCIDAKANDARLHGDHLDRDPKTRQDNLFL